MPLIPRVASFWRSVVSKDRLDHELDEELRGYLDALTEKKRQSGLDATTARRAALIEMGGVSAVAEEVREGRIGHGFDTTVLDIRQACRRLWKSPGFVLATVVTLALGIGANSAIFSVVNALLIAPLPYRDSSRLVFVWSDMSDAGYSRAPLSGPELGDLRERATLFNGFGAIWSNTAALTDEGDPEQLRIGLVTANFFSVLGADAALGRTFVAEDEMQTAPPSILLSAAVWQRRYGSDPTIVGRRILVNGRPTTVVGVMPTTFKLLMPSDASVPDDLQAWVPFPANLTKGPRGQQFLRVVGRMRPGATLEQGRQEVAGIASRISREFAEYGSSARVFNTVALQTDAVREIRPALLALFGGVTILLLIACVNVASLLIARSASRTRETAVRRALGASAGRLLRQCLVEGLLLATLGGVAGLVAGVWGLKVLLALRPESLSRIGAARVDPTVLAFTAVTALVWGGLFSLAPLRDVLRVDVLSALQQDARRSSGSVQYRTRATLVVVQIALGLVLLVSAGLLVRTFIQLQRVDPGFRADSALTFRVAIPLSRYRTPDEVNAFARRLQGTLAALPGVTGTGATSHLPYDNLPNWWGPYATERGADESRAPHADYRAITPGLFEAIGVTLLEGRFFTEPDDRTTQPVVMVDDVLARRAWPGQSAIGKALAADPGSTGHATVWATVVGVVRHVRHRSLFEPSTEQVYFPQRRILRNPLAYIIHTSDDPASLTGPIRDAIAHLDAQLPIYDVRLLDDYLVAARATRRFTMILAAAFALVALALAWIGVYGVVAYAVTRRQHEFGVRLALGAQPRQVIGLVMREGAGMAAIGLAVGVAGAIVAAHFLRTQLYGVTPGDLVSYAVAIPVLGLSVMLASWLPARRSTRVNPVEALRA
jgi:predicted permease